MKQLRLHPHATAETLAVARLLIACLWIARLVPDPIHRLGHLPAEFWFARGVLGVLPESLMAGLLDPAVLWGLKLVAIALAAIVALGVRPQRLSLAALMVVLIVYLGIGQGFGAHGNHRELVLLYVTALLVFLPCFDALAVQARRRKENEIYRASMIAICIVIATSYVFVGAARVAIGFPDVYDPDVMLGWMVGRSLRPNPLGLELGAAFLNLPLSRYAIPLMLPASTVMELMAPLLLGLRERPRAVLLGALAGMHVAIALLMNIVFIENVLLLVLFVNYTPWLVTARSPHHPELETPSG